MDNYLLSPKIGTPIPPIRTVRSSVGSRGLNASSNSGTILEKLHPARTETVYYTFRMTELLTGLIKYEDPETAAMSDAELRAEALAAFGSWADRDDLDDLYATMHNSWFDRLDELYGPTDPV